MTGTVHTEFLTPAEALAAGESRVGGKATGLSRLAATGARVPCWMVLPVDAFARHLARANIATDDPRDARRRITATPPDPTLAAAVRNAVRGRVAVRSSAVGEDSATRSHAGVFDSYLSLTDEAQVLDAIVRCWASAFGERAVAYGNGTPAVAVIVQEMVEGEVSGVLFTRNPVTGRDDEAVISSCWGLGEGIVSGRCATDELTLSHDGRELSLAIADKDVHVLATPAGGTQPVPVETSRRRVRSLGAADAAQLLRTGLEVAHALGGPQDIEWTLRDGELFVLQARPITGAGTPLGTQRRVWDNSNIQESFMGVTSPLTFSLAVRAYERTWTETHRLLGASERTLKAHEPVFRNMIGLVDGRVYYNLDNWYRTLLLLPGFGRTKASFEATIGLEQPVDFIEDQRFTRAQKLRRLPALVRAGGRVAREFRRRERSIVRFLGDLEARMGALDRDALAAADLDRLLPTADRLLALFDAWAVPTLNDMFLARSSRRLRALLAASFGEEADELLVGLLSGEDAIESKEPTRHLVELASLIRADAELLAALDAGKLDALRERSPAVAAALDDYIERYGDRCMGEQKLETISLRQDPAFLVKVLRNFVAQPELDGASLDRAERTRRLEYERRAFVALGPRGRRRLQRLLADARSGVKERENLRFARTRLVGWARTTYIAIGLRLHEAGLLDEPRDVFYLTAEELLAFGEGRSATADLAALARLRRAEYTAYEDVVAPNRLETFGTPARGPRRSPAPPVTACGRTLVGIGCCPGVVEAEVCVILSPDDDLSVNGRILTTVRTDPGWGPLFAGAAGLLIERGSTLSHSAILAREFGIPCVVGVPGLLQSIRHGERVRLNGGVGTVERLESP